MKLELQLDFQAFCPCFEHAPRVEGAYADAPAHHAAAYLAFLQVKPFGKAVIHRKVEWDKTIKTEKVEAFTFDRYLIVARTTGDTTRVFQFQAPLGLLLQEAIVVAQEHYKMSTLDLIS
ncbi:TPA: hypothetical protein ACKPJR_006354 [Pseudomonas aeruginosa]